MATTPKKESFSFDKFKIGLSKYGITDTTIGLLIGFFVYVLQKYTGFVTEDIANDALTFIGLIFPLIVGSKGLNQIFKNLK